MVSEYNSGDITQYTYDNNGNQLGTILDGMVIGNKYSYNARNQQIQSITNENTVDYTYYPNGLRMTAGEMRHIWDGNNIIAERIGTYGLNKYIRGIQLIASEYAGINTRKYYLYNDNGDVVQLKGNDGTIYSSYDYDSFGNPMPVNGQMPSMYDDNPFRYRGEYLDTQTGNYYLRARYYDPSIGRFTQEDTHWNVGNMVYDSNGSVSLEAIFQSGNLYGYCMGNPVNMMELLGYVAAYINSQSDRTWVEINGKGRSMNGIKWGLLGNFVDNGCGIIAAYNVMLSKKSDIDFGKVKDGILFGGGALAFGKFGVNPIVLTEYMQYQFDTVFTQGPITYFWGALAELSQNVIVLYKNRDSLSMHYVAGIGTGNGGVGGSFIFYNTQSDLINGIEMSIWEFIDIIKADGCFPLYIIGVS